MELMFEREPLYCEVWSSSISTLAKKYGLSDIGLRKVCIALAIPLPGKGHWQKVAAGHQIAVPPLRPTTGRTTFACRRHNVVSRAPLPTSDEDWLQQRLAFELDPHNAVVVAAELVKAHRLVAAAATAARTETSGLLKSRDRKAKPRKPGALWARTPMLHLKPHWRDYEQRGVLELDAAVLPLRVSIETVDRALRIWDALIKACGARGLSVSVDRGLAKIADGVDSVGLRMSEKVIRITRPAAWGGVETVSRNATGQLRIFVVYLGEAKFEDSAKRPLEAQLNDILTRVHRVIASQRAGRAIAAEKSRLDAADARSREEELQRHLAAQAQEEAERERQRLLSAEATAWREARSIREYVEHVRAAATASGHSAAHGLREWSDWAMAVADELDPTSGRLRDQGGDKLERAELQPSTHYEH